MEICRRDIPVRWQIAAMQMLLGISHFAVLLTAGRSHAADLEIVVPAYFYPSPGSPWNQLNSAVSQVRITAIMNPGSGPGTFKDSNYTAAVNTFRAAGGRVIAYVDSSYGAIPLETVKANIDTYAAWYNIDGIFIDQMANTPSLPKLNYYAEIYDYVKMINEDWQVMANPGTNTLEPYKTKPTADSLMISENYGNLYEDWEPSPWVFNHAPSAFVHLIHTEPSSEMMLHDLTLAVERNAGGIFITDDPLIPNPWDTLPSYWQQLVDAVAAINADYNGNGTVDAADYTVWRASFGQTGADLAADGNRDAVVDELDFAFWKTNFGASAGGGAGGAATSQGVAAPEPSTIVLAAVVLALLSASFRRASARISNE